MAHYAFLDENNIVTQVIVGKDEGEGGVDWEERYGSIRKQKCKRTSYNTKGGVHQLGGTPFRKNFAGIGFSYNEIRDAFIPPRPFPSWTLNEDSCMWDPPVAIPEDHLKGKFYMWDEITQSWKNVAPPE